MRCLTLIAIFVFFSSCMSHKDYTSDSVPLQSVSLELDTIPDYSTYFNDGNWPSKNWWEIFEDEQLNFLIQLALSGNYNLQKAKSRMDAAYYEALVSKSKLFPTVGFNVKDFWQHIGKDIVDDLFPGGDTTINLIAVGPSFTYEFDFWGKNRSYYESMLGKANAQVAESEQVNLVVSISVATDYFALKASKVREKFIRKIIDDIQQLQILTNMRIQNDLDDAFPMLSLSEKLKKNQDALEAEKAKQTILLTKINTFLGRAPLDEIKICDTWDPRTGKIGLPSNLGLDLVARRPDLAMQIWLVQAASKNVYSAKAEFYPNIDLSAYGGFASTKFSNLFTHNGLGALVIPSFHLPIFTGGKLKANLASKLKLFEEEVHKYNQMLLTAAKEVSDQSVLLKQSMYSLNKKEAILEDQIATYNLHLSRFNQGLDTSLDVIKKDIDVQFSKIKLLDQQLNYQTETINLIKSLGGGFYQPIDIKIEARHGR